MSEESATPDLVRLTHQLGNAQGVDATMQFYGTDAVYDMSRVGLGTFEGRAAIRGFLEDWLASYRETEDEIQEAIDLGNGIVFASVRETGRPSGSPTLSRVQAVYGFVFLWTDGKVARVTVYTDPDEARAAAERLAESTGWAMSQENVEVVRRLLRRVSDGDVDAALGDVAPDAVLDWSDSHAPDGGVYHGPAEWRAWLHGRQEGLTELRFDTTEVIDAQSDTVLTVARLQARGRASGLEVEALGAALWTLHDGLVTALTLYQTRDEALRAAGLT